MTISWVHLTISHCSLVTRFYFYFYFEFDSDMFSHSHVSSLTTVSILHPTSIQKSIKREKKSIHYDALPPYPHSGGRTSQLNIQKRIGINCGERYTNILVQAGGSSTRAAGAGGEIRAAAAAGSTGRARGPGACSPAGAGARSWSPGEGAAAAARSLRTGPAGPAPSPAAGGRGEGAAAAGLGWAVGG